jgi:AcrR family transcriptional regulator
MSAAQTKQSERSRKRARAPEAKQELRESILREATTLFVEHGFDAFSMRKLADRIGYSAAAIYVHFASKDELLAEIIGEGYERLQTYLEDPDGPRVRRVGERYLDFAFQNPELYRLMFVVRPKSLFDLDAERVAKRLEGLRIAERAFSLAQGEKPLGAFTPMQAAESAWSFMHGLVTLALTVPIYDEAWARRTLEMALQALNVR